MSDITDQLSIEQTDLESALLLRTQFSDPPRSREAALSPGDTMPGCVHFGAYLRGELVGVCSVGPEALPVLDHRDAWRMRGLAVRPQFRGSGIGSALLTAPLQYIATQPDPYAWGYVKRRLTHMYGLLGFFPTGFTHRHPVSGETLLFGNDPLRRLIENLTGVRYANGELPDLGAVDPHQVVQRTASR